MTLKETSLFKALLFILGFFFIFSLYGEGQQPSLKLKVAAEQANIRLKPDIGSIIIQQVPQGTILESSGKEGAWYKIKIETEEPELTFGYVHESLVIVISAPPEKEQKEITEKVEEPEKPEEKEEPGEPQIPPITLPPSFQPAQFPFSLSLTGGGNYVHGGDLNSGAKGLADFYSDSLALEGKGKVKPARLSYIYGGELSFMPFSNLSLGLGVDYFLGEKESRVEFRGASTTNVYITRPKIWAVPLRLFLSYYPLPRLYFKAGVEYYFAKCAYFYRYEREEFWQEWKGEAKARDFGFIGGFGFEWRLASPLSFVIEAIGRYARITGFTGTDNYRDSEGLESTVEGKLYFYQKLRIIGEKGYPHLRIHEKKPSAYVSDVVEAKVNFSGISLKFGLKLRF